MSALICCIVPVDTDVIHHNPATLGAIHSYSVTQHRHATNTADTASLVHVYQSGELKMNTIEVRQKIKECQISRKRSCSVKRI